MNRKKTSSKYLKLAMFLVLVATGFGLHDQPSYAATAIVSKTSYFPHPVPVFVTVNNALSNCLRGSMQADFVGRNDETGVLYSHFPNGGYQTTYWQHTSKHLDGGITHWHLESWQVPLLNYCLFQAAETALGEFPRARIKSIKH